MLRLLRDRRTVPPFDRRTVLLICGAVLLVAAALLTPLPSPRQIQDWALDAGPLFPLLFFAAHALITIAPVPRTVFTIASGLLFGPVLGLAIAVGATTVAAVLAFLLVRAVDRERFAARLDHPAVHAVNERLRRRGWLAVVSLRLIAFAPFSVVNYCCALSALRFGPYVLATVAGVLPGTIGTVILADALAGGSHPAMIVVSILCVLAGMTGLVVDHRWRPADAPPAEHPPARQV